VTLKPDHILFFTCEEEPDQISVGTYICEHGGTLKLFLQSYVDGEPTMMLVLAKIAITFPSSDTLVMDVQSADQVWTYERVK